MLGGLLKRKEDYCASARPLQTGTRLEAENLYALVNMGGISAAVGNLSEALHWYKILRGRCNQLIGRGKTGYWTYCCLGEAAVALGDKDGALQHIGRPSHWRFQSKPPVRNRTTGIPIEEPRRS